LSLAGNVLADLAELLIDAVELLIRLVETRRQLSFRKAKAILDSVEPDEDDLGTRLDFRFDLVFELLGLGYKLFSKLRELSLGRAIQKTYEDDLYVAAELLDENPRGEVAVLRLGRAA
jgi:hypothetical protein